MYLSQFTINSNNSEIFSHYFHAGENVHWQNFLEEGSGKEYQNLPDL